MGMEKMQAASILTVAVTLLLAAAGALTVGWMQGWFDKKESGATVLTERGGVAYPVEKDTGWFPNYGCSSYVLSNGDSVEWRYTCSNGADIGG